MPRLLALLIGLTAAAMFAACSNQRGFQEEPPIKVRGGSIDVLTPEQTEWEEEGSGGNQQWTQNRENGGGAADDLFLEVQYNDGTPTCTAQGKTIEIVRSGGTATFKRTGKKVKLTPKESFRHHAATKRIVVDSSAGAITKVVAKQNASQTECPGPKTLHDVICIASVSSMACH